MNFRDEDELVDVAGQYVLGVLPKNEMDEIEREMSRNHNLASAVGFWSDKLLDIAPPPPAVAPAADTWRRIEQEIRVASRGHGSSNWWNSLHFWRFAGMAGFLATLLLSIYLTFALPDRAEPTYVAVLQSPAPGTSWLVEVNTEVVRLRPLAPVALPAGKSVQFWTKPEGASAPTSLGLVATDRPTVVTTEKLPGMGVNQLFEVTLEPEQGSPTGRPTGPILAVGKAIRL